MTRYSVDPDFNEIPAPNFYMTMLDHTGDTTVTWTEPDDVEVLTYIQKKIDEGFVFFIERPRAIRAFVKKKRIKDVGQIKERKLTLMDEDAKQLELSGKLQLTTLVRPNEAANDAPVRKATSAKDVARNRSMAVRPCRGG